jgi:diguanylate cyclase (GGDEF)-like protein
MFIYRSFSPNQVMARNRYSINMPLYTAIFEATFTTSERYLKQLQKSFGHYAQLNIESVDCVENFENRSLRIQSSSVNDKLLVESKEQLANFAVSVDKGYLDQRLTPYRNTIIKTVGIGVLLAFLLLKALIHQQVLTPVLKLTKQVNKAIDGEINELKPSLQHDEVAMLNNGYVTLLGRLTKMAKYDNLTGLANRRLFDNHLDAFLNRSRSDQGKGALFFIDLDNFKQVNDTYGHSMGDALLADFANQLSKLFRYGEVFSLAPNDHSIARLAGDEFAVLLDGMPNTQAIAIAAQRVTSLFNGGYTLQGKVLDVHASIGIAVFPDDANTKEVLTSRADAAMYQVKRSGKNGFQFYSQELEHEAMQSTQIEAALHRALAEDNFHLNFMPIYATSDLQLTGFEVLLRSNCPILAQFGPAQFIPVAESTGIIKQLDYYVIEQALAHCRRLIDDHEFAGVMAINFSAWQLRNPEFTSVVKGLIEQYQVPPHQLELEITETCTVDNSESATELLHSLKQLNVKLSLDDFGTGYTAFKQLLNFPVDTIKIDRSFIAIINDLEESSDKAIIKILAELASLYQLDAVAEGVETQTQLEFVRSVGIQRVQGYLLSKPINYDQLVAMIAQGQKESNHH